MKLRMSLWLGLLALTAQILVPAAAVPQPAGATASEPQNVELFLLADYGTGFPVTVSAPRLMAQLVSCQQDVCSPCLQQQALVMSHITQALDSPASHTVIPLAAKCTAPEGLAAGLYSLQAAVIAGSEEATWSCFQHSADGSATKLNLLDGIFDTDPTAEMKLLNSQSEPGINSSSSSSYAGPFVSKVELLAGNTYTCVASYRPAKPAAAAPAAVAVAAPTTQPPVPASAPASVTSKVLDVSEPAAAAQPAVPAAATAAVPAAVAAAITTPLVMGVNANAADAAAAATEPAAAAAVAAGPASAGSSAAATTPSAAAGPNITAHQTQDPDPAAAQQRAGMVTSPAAAAVSASAAAATPGTAAAATPGTAATAADTLDAALVPAATAVPAAPGAEVPAAAVQAAADPVPVAQAPASASSASDPAAPTTDSMTFSTTDMTTDETTTTTVTFNTTTGNILDMDAELTAACLRPAYKQPPRGEPAAPLAVSGSRLVNSKTKKAVYLRGINWFGFNVDLGMLNGLWAGGSDATTDFSKIAFELKLLGYNAVRLPFAHNFLNKTDVWDAVRNCTTMSDSDFKIRVIDPQDLSLSTKSKDLPTDPSPMRNKPRGSCNTYLPARNNEDRLLFVIQQFIALGMYVVLDYQPQGLENYAYNLAEFVGAWQFLWKKVTCLPNFSSDIANRVLIDVMNEPDSMGIKWEANGEQPGAEQLYLSTAQALWQMTPNKMLFMFEGTGQNMFGLNWGNGFVTDMDIITSKGLSNPIPFFQKLVKKPFAKNTVISPHLYPPSITKSTYLGEGLWKQSNTSFGYLQSQGFCDSGSCRRFPIVIGETGSAYTDDTDKVWLQDFAKFVMAKGSARAYNRSPIAGWMWWAFNENSSDTGGIVMNNWQDLNWIKLRYMMDNLGLQPWYKQPSSSRRRRSRQSRGGSGGTASSRSVMRRAHRRHGGHQVTFDWNELGFDIGTLPARS